MAVYGNHKLVIYSFKSQTWDLVYTVDLPSELTAMTWSRIKAPLLIVAQDRLRVYSTLNEFKVSWQSEILSDLVSYVEFNDDGDMFAAISNVSLKLLKLKSGLKIYVNLSNTWHEFILKHPHSVISCSWRRAMDSHENIIMTNSVDAVCRIWIQSMFYASHE